MSNFKKTSLALDKDEYEIFKKLSKLNNSDASKEVRKYMKIYNEENKYLLDKEK